MIRLETYDLKYDEDKGCFFVPTKTILEAVLLSSDVEIVCDFLDVGVNTIYRLIEDENFNALLLALPHVNKSIFNMYDSYGQTILHKIADSGCNNKKIINFFLDNVDNEVILANAKNSNLTCLHYAVMEGNYTFVKECMKRSFAKELADIENSDGLTPLYESVKKGYISIIRLLYDNASSETVCMECKSESNYTILNIAINHRNVDIVKLIAEDKEKFKLLLGKVDILNQTPLHHAITMNNYEIFELLYNNMTVDQICTQDKQGYNPLFVIAQNNHVKFIELLFSKDDVKPVLINSIDIYGQTPLHWSAWNGHLEVSEILYNNMTIDQISKVMGPDIRHQTALHFAAQANKIEIIKLLLSKDEVKDKLLDIVDNKNRSALYCAAYLNHYEACEILHANMTTEQINVASKDGLTALQVTKNDDIIKLLS